MNSQKNYVCDVRFKVILIDVVGVYQCTVALICYLFFLGSMTTHRVLPYLHPM